MVTFGLTGGIATGKSRITKLFLANDIPMVDADEVARQLVHIGNPAYLKLFQTFGPKYFTYDGYLDRKKLAGLIFFNKDARMVLDSIMIPLIRAESNKQIEAFHKAGNKFVGFDSALIVEAGDADNYRPLVVVHCAPETQIARMMRRNLLTRDEAVARLHSQLPREEKIKVADFVIDSSGTVEETAQQAQSVIHKIRTQYPR